MHHLEPLSWSLTPSRLHMLGDDPASLSAADPAAAMSETSHRAITRRACLRLIAEYRQSCRQSESPQTLATTAKAALELARIDFEWAAAQPGCTPALRGELKACLGDLDGSVRRWSSGTELPGTEALHALDGLLVLLLQVEALGARGQVS